MWTWTTPHSWGSPKKHVGAYQVIVAVATLTAMCVQREIMKRLQQGSHALPGAARPGEAHARIAFPWTRLVLLLQQAVPAAVPATCPVSSRPSNYRSPHDGVHRAETPTQVLPRLETAVATRTSTAGHTDRMEAGRRTDADPGHARVEPAAVPLEVSPVDPLLRTVETDAGESTPRGGRLCAAGAKSLQPRTPLTQSPRGKATRTRASSAAAARTGHHRSARRVAPAAEAI